MSFQHASLAAGRWSTLTLMEQLGNIGSEVYRTMRAQGDPKRFEAAMTRALELFDLTLQDPRWKSRLKEIARARECFCDAFFGGHAYGSTFEGLNRYFFPFAMAAQLAKTRK